jgi:hypothetical protein
MTAYLRISRVAAVTAALGAAAVSCAGRDAQTLPPVVLGMLETTPPIFEDGEDKIFQVGREVPLPFRRPEDGERPKGQQDPYPRPAFHVATRSRTTVRYTLSNLEDRQVIVELLLDPWNEFVRYQPGVDIVRNDEAQPNLSGIDRRVILPPKGRVQGIVTPDDMVELATDLTVAMALQKRPPPETSAFAGPALYNRTFDAQNRSSEPDAVLAPWLPATKATVAAVTGFDLGLRTTEAARVAVELVIDIDDLDGDRVLMEGDDGRALGRPGTVLTPPAAPAVR